MLVDIYVCMYYTCRPKSCICSLRTRWDNFRVTQPQFERHVLVSELNVLLSLLVSLTQFLMSNLECKTLKTVLTLLQSLSGFSHLSVIIGLQSEHRPLNALKKPYKACRSLFKGHKPREMQKTYEICCTGFIF